MNSIALQPVSSTHIRGVGYDPRTSTLAVQFREGGIYHYHATPPQLYEEFLAAPSKGKFFKAAIKSRFRAAKVSNR
jgi:hypothetical protein